MRQADELVCTYTLGAVRPYMVVAKGEDKDGLYEYDAVGTHLLDCICAVLDYDPANIVQKGAMPVVEHLSARKSKADNGFDVEARVYGRSLSGLRIARVDVPCVLVALASYIDTAWAAAKHNIEVANYDMQVERGVNGHGR